MNKECHCGRTDTQVKPPEYIPSFLHCHSACKDCSTQFDPGEIWSDQSSVSQVTATRRWKTGSPPFLQKKTGSPPHSVKAWYVHNQIRIPIVKRKKTKSEFQRQEHKAVDRPVVVQSVNCHAPVVAQSCSFFLSVQLAYKPSFFYLSFQPEQYFSLIKNQSEQCFSLFFQQSERGQRTVLYYSNECKSLFLRGTTNSRAWRPSLLVTLNLIPSSISPADNRFSETTAVLTNTLHTSYDSSDSSENVQ
jgi:hypothetical protein